MARSNKNPTRPKAGIIRRPAREKTVSESPVAPAPNAVSHQEIAAYAYYLWEQEGRPADRALEHWLHAEAQFRRDRSPNH